MQKTEEQNDLIWKFSLTIMNYSLQRRRRAVVSVLKYDANIFHVSDMVRLLCQCSRRSRNAVLLMIQYTCVVMATNERRWMSCPSLVCVLSIIRRRWLRLSGSRSSRYGNTVRLRTDHVMSSSGRSVTDVQWSCRADIKGRYMIPTTNKLCFQRDAGTAAQFQHKWFTSLVLFVTATKF